MKQSLTGVNVERPNWHAQWPGPVHKRGVGPVSAHRNDGGGHTNDGKWAEWARMLQSPTRKLHVFTSGGVF